MGEGGLQERGAQKSRNWERHDRIGKSERIGLDWKTVAVAFTYKIIDLGKLWWWDEEVQYAENIVSIISRETSVHNVESAGAI